MRVYLPNGVKQEKKNGFLNGPTFFPKLGYIQAHSNSNPDLVLRSVLTSPWAMGCLPPVSDISIVNSAAWILGKIPLSLASEIFRS